MLAMFQSTRPRGARRAIMAILFRGGKVSIHAPAWGATLAALGVKLTGVSFNPRARVGRDLNLYLIKLLLHMFQSTRPRGARLADEQEYLASLKVSIHAPAWGATLDETLY